MRRGRLGAEHEFEVAGDGIVEIWEAFSEFQGNKFQLYNVGLHHLAFAAPNRAAVDALHDKLVTEGAKILDPPKNYPYFRTYYALYFTDPDDIKIEYAFVET